jgi:short-subunit dehydrogenase
MLDTNIRPQVFFSKYALLNFARYANTHAHKTALAHTSSIASDLNISPFSAIYAGTKRFNEVLAINIAAENDKQFATSDLVVTQILKPGVIHTALAEFKKGPLVVSPQECVSGSLADLGS